MTILVECPYCDHGENLDIEDFGIDISDFRDTNKRENLKHTCALCQERYTFDIEMDISTMSFVDQYSV